MTEDRFYPVAVDMRTGLHQLLTPCTVPQEIAGAAFQANMGNFNHSLVPVLVVAHKNAPKD